MFPCERLKQDGSVVLLTLMHSHSFLKVLDLSYTGFVKLALRLLVKFERMGHLFYRLFGRNRCL